MKKEDIKVTVNIIPKYETEEEYNKAMAKIFAEFHYNVNCRLEKEKIEKEKDNNKKEQQFSV